MLQPDGAFAPSATFDRSIQADAIATRKRPKRVGRGEYLVPPEGGQTSLKSVLIFALISASSVGLALPLRSACRLCQSRLFT